MIDRVLSVFGLRRKGEVAVSAVVIRADGTREDLGVIARGKMGMTPGAGEPAPDAFLLGPEPKGE